MNKSGMPGIGETDPADLEAQACAELGFSRVACDEEGNGDGGKSDGDEGGGRATATSAMAMEKANNNQPATGLAKAGGSRRESVNVRPRIRKFPVLKLALLVLVRVPVLVWADPRSSTGIAF
jgi:hypothetical protein